MAKRKNDSQEKQLTKKEFEEVLEKVVTTPVQSQSKQPKESDSQESETSESQSRDDST